MPVRRDRRSALRYQGFLREKSKLPYKKWLEYTSESIKSGYELFNSNKELIEKSINKQLEDKELILIEYWKELNYSTEEIDKLREVFAMSSVKYKDTLKEDKKAVKSLIKEINQLAAERKNG